MDIQREENLCLYEILRIALRVCLQKCSALSLNLKICSIFSAFNSAHNAFAEQMRQCCTVLGIAYQFKFFEKQAQKKPSEFYFRRPVKVVRLKRKKRAESNPNTFLSNYTKKLA